MAAQPRGRTLFSTFLGTLVADYAAYLESSDLDLGADRVGYRQVPLWLSDEEFDEMIEEIRTAVGTRLSNQPGSGRQRRLLTTIVMPDTRTPSIPEVAAPTALAPLLPPPRPGGRHCTQAFPGYSRLMEQEAIVQGVSHVSLSVSNLHRSLEFYRDVLKLPLLQRPFRGTKFDGEEAMCQIGQTALVLQCHADHQGGAFDPRRTGLDHLAFHVSSRDALEEWETLLDESACSHSGIIEIEGWGWMIEFRDPDGIQLELFALSR